MKRKPKAGTEERTVAADDSEGYLSVSGPGGGGGDRGDAVTFITTFYRRPLKYLPCLREGGTKVYAMRDRMSLLISNGSVPPTQR